MADAFATGFATGQKAYESWKDRQDKDKDRESEKRERESRAGYYDAQAEQIRGERADAEAGGAGMLSAKRAIIKRADESKEEHKARVDEYNRANPRAGTDNAAARGAAAKVKADAMSARQKAKQDKLVTASAKKTQKAQDKYAGDEGQSYWDVAVDQSLKAKAAQTEETRSKTRLNYSNADLIDENVRTFEENNTSRLKTEESERAAKLIELKQKWRQLKLDEGTAATARGKVERQAKSTEYYNSAFDIFAESLNPDVIDSQDSPEDFLNAQRAKILGLRMPANLDTAGQKAFTDRRDSLMESIDGENGHFARIKETGGYIERKKRGVMEQTMNELVKNRTSSPEVKAHYDSLSPTDQREFKYHLLLQRQIGKLKNTTYGGVMDDEGSRKKLLVYKVNPQMPLHFSPDGKPIIVKNADGSETARVNYMLDFEASLAGLEEFMAERAGKGPLPTRKSTTGIITGGSGGGDPLLAGTGGVGDDPRISTGSATDEGGHAVAPHEARLQQEAWTAAQNKQILENIGRPEEELIEGMSILDMLPDKERALVMQFGIDSAGAMRSYEAKGLAADTEEVRASFQQAADEEEARAVMAGEKAPDIGPLPFEVTDDGPRKTPSGLSSDTPEGKIELGLGKPSDFPVTFGKYAARVGRENKAIDKEIKRINEGINETHREIGSHRRNLDKNKATLGTKKVKDITLTINALKKKIADSEIAVELQEAKRKGMSEARTPEGQDKVAKPIERDLEWYQEWAITFRPLQIDGSRAEHGEAKKGDWKYNEQLLKYYKGLHNVWVDRKSGRKANIRDAQFFPDAEGAPIGWRDRIPYDAAPRGEPR